MTDIKNVRLLWIKGGLFLLLGCIASGLILLSVGNFAVAVLLAIAVWAFCRAYYFAFYVIEKYADPNFRYAGLTSLVFYCVAGPERYRQNQDDLADSTVSAELSLHHLAAARRLAIQWFAFAMVVAFVTPSVYGQFRFLQRSFAWNILEPIWIGWCAAIAAFCIIGGSLLKAPLKYRIPMSYGAIFSLSLTLILGLHLATGFPQRANADQWMLLAFASIVYVVGFTLLWSFRRVSRLELEITQPGQSPLGEVPSPAKEQVSLRYLFGTTTTIAVALALVKFLFPAGAFDNGPPVAIVVFVFLVGCAIIVFVAIVTIADLYIVFSNSARQRHSWTVFLLVCLVFLPPAIIFGIGQLPTPAGMGKSQPSTGAYVGMYAFFICYIAVLTCVLLTFSRAGLRLVRRASEVSLEKEVA